VSAAGFGVVSHLIEENRFPNSPKTNHQYALRMPAAPEPFYANTDSFSHVAAACQFWRRTSCA